MNTLELRRQQLTTLRWGVVATDSDGKQSLIMACISRRRAEMLAKLGDIQTPLMTISCVRILPQESDQRIVEDCNDLAHAIAKIKGVKRGDRFKFYKKPRVAEVAECWDLAVVAFDRVHLVDVEGHLDSWEDEKGGWVHD